MRYWKWIWMLGITSSLCAAGIPTKITYQGTLKDNGVPASGSHYLTFRIKDASGLTQYWDSGLMSVPVTNGLFSVELQPTGIDWQNVTPYIEVSVGKPPQTLAPLEPINASIYAKMAGSVIDGSITRQKLDVASFQSSGVGLVPPGAIMMFDATCPAGWTRYAALDNRFPMGSSIASTFGGSATHIHNVNPHTHSIPAHSHQIDNNTLAVGIGIRNIEWDNNLVMQVSGSVGSYSTIDANKWYGYGNGMSHPAPVGSNPTNVAVNGPRISGGTEPGGEGVTGSATATTDAQSNIPPYVSLIFCQKL